jgi:hypothetical protein
MEPQALRAHRLYPREERLALLSWGSSENQPSVPRPLLPSSAIDEENRAAQHDRQGAESEPNQHQPRGAGLTWKRWRIPIPIIGGGPSRSVE